MTTPQTIATTDPQGIIAALQQSSTRRLAREATLAEELAARTAELLERKSKFDERIEYQAATLDVLRAMSASPGDPQPVFQLIVERARAFCDADQANLALLDGDMLQLQARSGSSASYPAQFPRPVDATSTFGRAIIAGDVVQMPDVLVDPDHFRSAEATVRAVVAVPLLRRGAPVGAIAMGRNRPGEFSVTQMELLKTFAEQAVIAITSAETYRALQTRTADLQESLEYQTATSDVLKVISRSTFDLQPVLETVVKTAAQLCNAEMALIGRRDGERWRVAANVGFPPEYGAYERAHGAMAINPNSPSVGWRAVRSNASCIYTTRCSRTARHPTLGEFGLIAIAPCARSYASYSGGKPTFAATRHRSPSRRPIKAISALQSCAAVFTTVSSTGCKSNVERLMTFSTSLVAVWYSSDS